MERENTWGLQFVKVNIEGNNFETVLGLNVKTEEKAREYFDRIKNEFSENKGEPDHIVDLLDESDSIIEDYALTENQVESIVSLLGYSIEA